jgi:biofilm protein TabA
MLLLPATILTIDNEKRDPLHSKRLSGETTMKATLISITFGTILLFASALVAQSGSGTTWTKHKAKVWFDGGTWLNGLKLKPHKSVNERIFAEQYHLHPSFWDSAFAFLKNQDLANLPKGKYPIDGDNVFATVTEDSTKDFSKTRWESHRKYADIQYVIRGEEKIGVRPIAGAKVTVPYDPKGDVAHYSGPGKHYDAHPGTFFIFFPPDAHRPNITPGGNKVDKKIVVKIRVSGFEAK